MVAFVDDDDDEALVFVLEWKFPSDRRSSPMIRADAVPNPDPLINRPISSRAARNASSGTCLKCNMSGRLDCRNSSMVSKCVKYFVSTLLTRKMRLPTLAPAFLAGPPGTTVRTTVRSKTFSTVSPNISRSMRTLYSPGYCVVDAEDASGEFGCCNASVVERFVVDSSPPFLLLVDVVIVLLDFRKTLKAPPLLLFVTDEEDGDAGVVVVVVVVVPACLLNM